MTQGLVSRFQHSWKAFHKVWRAAKATPKSEGALEPLTPALLEGKQADRYEDVLLNALGNEQVRNVALTGGYGAGKSSVIRTFFDRHPEYKHVLVSLATFSKDSPIEGEAGTHLMSRIEETIVQQLLYAVPAKQLPKTRLKRIVQASKSSITWHTVFFALLIVSVLRMYLPSVNMLPKIDPAWLFPGLMRLPDWCALIFVGGSSLYILHSLLKFVSLFSIDGLTLKGGKLEATHHGSVLHKHVDEIIYCFERSDIDVVVIEDLDRFGIQDVFFRLREINFTIRQAPQIKRPVHFIYAIRDELFSVGEKTKFFDLIIPVIPVVNSENSWEKMTDLLKTQRFEAVSRRLHPGLIETVCNYIDDMRLIKNIVNEFDIFSSLLGGRGVQLEPSKLFAMVVVRNLYPEAFADLIKRRGPIYSVLIGFGEWRANQASWLERQAEEAHLPRFNKRQMPLEQEIELLKSQSLLVKRMPFRVAAKQKYGEVLAVKLVGLEAVVDLMQAGVFDTDYNDYLSFFYEGALTQDDKNLILALRRGESPPVMVIVNDPARVLAKLEHEALEEGRGFISGLVEYLCSQHTAEEEGPHAGKLATILNAAPAFMERFAETVDSILPSQQAPILIQAIYHSDPMLLEKLVISSRAFAQSGPRQALLCAIFSSLTYEQVAELEDCDYGVAHSVEGLSDVTQLLPLLAKGEGAWKWLQEKPVQFHNLSDTTQAEDLKQLLRLGFIEPRLGMLALMCSLFETNPVPEAPVTFRRLLALQLDGTDKLLAKDPTALVKVLLEQPGMLDECAESLNALLAAIGSEPEWVNALLERTDCPWGELKNAPVAIWTRLLDADRVSEKAGATWAYFLAIQGRKALLADLVKPEEPKKVSLNRFIERHASRLAETLWTLHPDRHPDLQAYLLRESAISDKTLMTLFSGTTLAAIETLVAIPQTRWGMLVSSDFLPYSEQISEIVQQNASPEEAEYFERRKPVFDATNSTSTPHMTRPGVFDI